MSYNITKWKIRRVYLELPLNFDFGAWVRQQPDRTPKGHKNVGKRWCLEDRDSVVRCNLAEKTWTLCASTCELSGVIEGDKLVISNESGFEWTGDGSGYLYFDILLPLFSDFKGDLDALVVWEGGDSIRQLTIAGGIAKDEEIQ